MRVSIDGKMFVIGENCSIIELVLESGDKENITNMESGANHYFSFDEKPETLEKVKAMAKELKRKKENQ